MCFNQRFVLLLDKASKVYSVLSSHPIVALSSSLSKTMTLLYHWSIYSSSELNVVIVAKNMFKFNDCKYVIKAHVYQVKKILTENLVEVTGTMEKTVNKISIEP